ncbi:MAG: T9SS type A sorting domain-containing protein [Candidatus Cloacimonetes bacterium]|nr:T9SS type A sorting domain-containing protein [Candidatus Cloacimonadota bacterium]
MRILLTSFIIFMMALCMAATPDWVNRTFIDDNGNEIWEVIIDNVPPENFRMPAVDVEQERLRREVVILDNVPVFDWCYGCANTSAAMMMGYYDRLNYSHLYSGPAGGGLCPLNNLSGWGWGESPLSATHQGYDGLNVRGHVDDYFVYEGYEGEDPYMTGGWEQHAYADCTGDYMGTSQYNQGNPDGGTAFYFRADGSRLSELPQIPGMRERDGCNGIANFVVSRGYHTSLCYTEGISGMTNFTFSDYMAEIDAGRPVMILVEGHAMVGKGYDSFDQTIYLHDTWDWSTHTMEWGESYSGMEQIAVCCFTLASNEVTANFVADEVHGAPPLNVEFNNNSTGYITGSNWDFDNDGSFDSTELDPAFTYTEPGIYTVTLHAYNWDYEDTITRTEYIIVNTPPQFNLPASLGFENGSELVVDLAEYSFDADGDDYTLTIGDLAEISVIQNGMVLTFTAPAGFEGAETLELTLDDGIDQTSVDCTILVYPAGGAVIYVPDDYATIQAAIDNAGHGYTIIARPGTYHENLEMGDNQIRLSSMYLLNGDESYINSTIINGNSGDVITITDGEILQEICGFKITHSIGGSGIEVGNRPVNLHHIVFYYNMNTRGSALNVESTEALVEYCTFYQNFTSGVGGTIYCDGAEVILNNLTFFNNYGNAGNAVLAENNSTVNMTNCIIWDNDDPVLENDEGSSISITYSDLQEMIVAEGNFVANPGFVNPGSYNLHLQANSPCVDTGNPDTDGDGVSWTEDIDDQDADGTRKDIGAWYYNQNYSADEQVIPAVMSLEAYPNPFMTGNRAQLKISYSLNTEGYGAALDIYNIKGQLVRSYQLPSGKKGNITWDGNNGSSGLYLLNLHSGAESISRKVLLIK